MSPTELGTDTTLPTRSPRCGFFVVSKKGEGNVSTNANVIKTLLEREWIRVLGHKEVPGRPEMLGTTRLFLDYFNLKSLDDLPGLAEIKALDMTSLQLDLLQDSAVETAAKPD